ncbi:hypothetical protein NP493_1345g00061 [Ridgeia piscesae]|uniref:RRM domain-containing protein n=1 Tax=Ridgeia piscesae TaxID=27915 RepID=A0AAD9K6H1_RIDPI|nr:hypothetical protein NP493_1345g00061 [Ridgeia piscesae]
MPPPPAPLGPMSSGGLDPASNNQPLHFNAGKMKSVMVHANDNLDCVPTKELESPPPPPGNNMAMGNMSMGHMAPMGPWPPMMGPMGMADPGMMMGAAMGYPQYAGYMAPGPMPVAADGCELQKDIITLKDCVLYPPPQNAPATTRERPPGCRTIFVGGLPENTTEDILRELFETCGNICSIRLSKKNFAHIRFDMEESVFKALYISGYRMKIGDSDDKANTGRLHVDYAQARDDLYEWECNQRLLARENRHNRQVEDDLLHPPSPPPITHFSDYEASVLLENLKEDSTFASAAHVLVTWLERGDCTRRTASIFYGLVQSTNTHIRRLLGEKATYETELQQMKLQFRQKLQLIIRQIEQINAVFTAAGKQKAWDHFTKAQRKNLVLWSKHCQEIWSREQEEFLSEREEAEMDMSDSEDGESAPVAKKKKKSNEITSGENVVSAAIEWVNGQLREDNDILKCQLEAYKNEVDLLKMELSESSGCGDKDKQITALKQALQGMQQQLISAKRDAKLAEEHLQKQLVSAKRDAKLSEENFQKAKEDACTAKTAEDTRAEGDTTTEGSRSTDTISVTLSVPPDSTLTEVEARLIGVIATFLHVHPFGASIDYICSYLTRLEMKTRSSEIEDLLERLPSVFRQDFHGVGASLEKRWNFVGFDIKSKSVSS